MKRFAAMLVVSVLMVLVSPRRLSPVALPSRRSTLSVASVLEPRFPPSSFHSIRALWTRLPPWWGALTR